MDIKNFVSRFSAQHKIIALAGFVCLAVFASAIIFNLASRNADNIAQAVLFPAPNGCAKAGETCVTVDDKACESTSSKILNCVSNPSGATPPRNEWQDSGYSNSKSCTGTTIAPCMTAPTVATTPTVAPCATISAANLVNSCLGFKHIGANLGVGCPTDGNTVCTSDLAQSLICQGGVYIGNGINNNGACTSNSCTCSDDWKCGCVASAVPSSGGACGGKTATTPCVWGSDVTSLTNNCGWDGADEYSYCTKMGGASGTSGRCAFAANKEEFCRECGTVREDLCSCTYKADVNATEIKILMGDSNKQCAVETTPFKNYELTCETGSGPADKNPCLNRQSDCQPGIGCASVNQDCVTMNGKIRDLIAANIAGKINDNGQISPTVTNNGEINTINEIESVINSYGLNISAIIAHAKKGGAYGSEEDIACAAVDVSKDCRLYNGGAEQYKCVAAGKCRVWDWAMGAALVDCQGRGCDYVNGVRQTNCKQESLVVDPIAGSCQLNGMTCGKKAGWQDHVFYCDASGNPDGNRGEIMDCAPGTCADGKCIPASGSQTCEKSCTIDSDCSVCGTGWTCKASNNSNNNVFEGSRYANITNNTNSYGICVQSSNPNQDSTSDGKGCTKTGYACQGKNGFYTDKCYDNSTASNASESSSNAYTLTYACNNGNCTEAKTPCQYGCSKSSQGHSCAKSEKDCMNPSEETQDPETKEEEEKKEDEEKKKEDNTAPVVTVTAPSGKVNSKTADLKATTNLKATCTYSDSVGSVSGMTMSSSDGYQHTATLGSLETNLASCKASHNITVTCVNAAASSKTSAASGTGQTTFEVDLSANAEYAPVVTSSMDAEEFAIANPILKVTSDRPAECEYKKDAVFAIGSGTKFDTTGNYIHNTQLTGLDENDGKAHVYYVVCKDKSTCATNAAGVKIQFKIKLTGVAPKIASTTPATQTAANPTLSITTDIPSKCQYKKVSNDGTVAKFVYDDGTGTQFTNDQEYSHTLPLSLADYPDGKYTFQVACKGISTGEAITFADAIVTTLTRSTVGPTISNTTAANQTTNTPVLSVITGTTAICQYKEGANFVFGDTTAAQFTTDGTAGATAHSSTLPPLADGQHTFYVVCKDVATGIANATGTQIIFTVAATPMTCANLNSNDKLSDNEREAEEQDDSDSKYLWRSVESGTRDKFAKVDWYAGYQFTPTDDGQVTQLCGYFGDGNNNKITLYNGAYKEIASAQVAGEDGWKCVNITPVQVKTDKRYYVIARMKDNPIYYEYKAGLLPRDAETATVDAGIRQLATESFGNNIKKYDYMVFGLVDVKIKLAEANTTGPEVSSPAISTSDGVISVQTNIDATCRFDRDDVAYSSMRYTFSKTSAKLHEQKLCNLESGPFTFYVRCKGTTGENNASTPIQFEVID